MQAQPLVPKARPCLKEREAKEALGTIRGWFQHPATKADSMIVGFCY
jgi:hypothetical protein